MDDELLIDLVEGYPVLYDRKHAGYRNTERRSQAWQRIAENMGSDASTVQRRWVSLRDRFGKEIRLPVPAYDSDSDFPPPKQWVHLTRLSFLRKHIIQRPLRQGPLSKKTPRREPPEVDEEYSSSYDPLEVMGSNAKKTKLEPQTSPMRETYVVNIEPRSRSPSSSQSPTRRTRQSLDVTQTPPRVTSPSPGIPSSSFKYRKGNHKRKTFGFGQLDEAIFESAQIFKDICKQKASNPIIDPQLSGFATMICATISKFNTKRRIDVIQRCTEIVMQAAIDEEDQN